MSQITESIWSNRCYYEAAMDAYQVFKATGKTAQSKVHSPFEAQSARFFQNDIFLTQQSSRSVN